MTDELEEKVCISKTRVKKEMQALRDLGKALVPLTPAQLDKIPISAPLLDAILDAKRFKNKALKRQIQYIGVLLREEDADAIRDALTQLHKPHKHDVKAFHEIEKWRDGLITGEEGMLDKLFARFPHLDRQHINQLIRNTRKERELNKPPKAARALFRYLRELAQEE